MPVAAEKKTDLYPQYQTPKDPYTAFLEPAFEDLDDYASKRHVFDSGSDLRFCGKSLDEARSQARVEVVRLAIEYTRGYGSPSVTDAVEAAQRPIVLAGHQPELFHPGVWFKNFLLARFARQCESVSINFLVDNDLCRSTSINVPTHGTDGRLQLEAIPFDAPRPSVPWEVAGVESWEVWERFPDAVREKLADPAEDLLVAPLWNGATESVKRHGNIGRALSEGRHRIELQEGLPTLEVPLSRMVSTRAFARFSIHLLADLPRFQLIYNTQRDLYRRAHKIRNEAHPVPPLGQSGDWLEAPWWVYRPIDPQRRPLWVRMYGDSLILSDRAGWQAELEGRLDCDNAASQWLELLADGICLRPRALLTTMYLRIFVSDLFIHGIGGGKYDQLTNGIIRDFFELEPPPMGVASATIPLPQHDRWVSYSVAELEERLRKAKEKLWDLQHHAEKYLLRQLEQAPEEFPPERARRLKELVDAKRRLLANVPPRGEKSGWHQQMRSIRESLQQMAAEHAAEVEKELQRLTDQLAQAQLAESREYSFCLFGRRWLVDLLKRLAEIDQP